MKRVASLRQHNNMAINLYIVRHGQTQDNLEGRIQGHTDSPLTELGIKQAEAIARRLAAQNLSAIYSSDLGRAVTTAQAIARAQNVQMQPHLTPLLRELNLGKAQGLTREQYAQQRPEEFKLWQRDSIKHRPCGAETVEQAIERCGQFIEYVRSKHKDGETLGVIGHGGSLKGMLIYALGLPVECYRKLLMANTSLSILEIGDQSRLRLFNDTCHLEVGG